MELENLLELVVRLRRGLKEVERDLQALEEVLEEVTGRVSSDPLLGKELRGRWVADSEILREEVKRTRREIDAKVASYLSSFEAEVMQALSLQKPRGELELSELERKLKKLEEELSSEGLERYVPGGSRDQPRSSSKE